ncbi:hypothetical protein F4811DRAFT_150700 [Daldinia bambusicola]|nr:hypothetical protein F4811DRAFT_150700 [Daldinia bambusicola]
MVISGLLIQLDCALLANYQPFYAQVLGFTKPQFETVVLSRLIAHIIFQIPSNIFLSALSKPGIYVSRMMIAWGLVKFLICFARGVAEVTISHVILGALESTIFPGFLYLLSC